MTIRSDPRNRSKLAILCVCCGSILMVGLDVTILNVALPSLQAEFHASIAGAQWTIDAYIVGIGSLLISSGAAADRFGRRRIFQIGLSLFTLGSLLCSLAPSLGWVVAFRVLQAIGGSMLNPVALSIISNTFRDPEERARAFGVWGGVAGVSMAAGPVIGGVLIDSIVWRSIFWLNVPIGAAAFVLTGLLVPESKAPIPRKADLAGQALVISLFGTLVFAIIEGPELGWGSSWIATCFAVSGLSLVGLIAVEHARREPLIDLRFFSSAPFSGANVVAFAAFAVLGGFLFFNTLYLQDALGYSAIRAGLFLLPTAAATAVCSPLSGVVLGRFGPRIPLVGGSLAMSASMALFAIAGPNISQTTLFAGYVLTGVGIGLANAAITNTAISGMPRSETGLAAAIVSTMRQVGQALGVAVVGSVIASFSASLAPGPAFADAWRMSWWILAGCAGSSLGVAVLTTGAWGAQTAERARGLIRDEARRVARARAAADPAGAPLLDLTELSSGLEKK